MDLVISGEQAIDFACEQLSRLVKTHPDEFPSFTQQGRWVRQVPGWTNWCEGFLGGQLWLVYQATGDAWFRKQAEHYTRLLEPRKTDRSVHDLGFLFWPTWKRWYDLEGDPAANAVLIEAGRTLALRYQEKGGYLCSFQGAHSLYIDIMMNIGLVFYAASQTGDDQLWDIARQHCLTTRRVLVRGDDSTAHEGLFDPTTGQFLRQQTQQGWRDDSTWARGHAWALYGFTTAYVFSQEPIFLDTAERLADFYIERTPAHGVPPNDWEEPQPQVPYESSTAAIAASGLLDLSQATQDARRRRLYRDYARQISDTLTTPEFLARSLPGWEGILLHGIYHQPQGVGVDESTMWGDYYFLEGLCKTLSETG
jgi:unsaturated chondroitin disaccharide hydrolase